MFLSWRINFKRGFELPRWTLHQDQNRRIVSFWQSIYDWQFSNSKISHVSIFSGDRIIKSNSSGGRTLERPVSSRVARTLIGNELGGMIIGKGVLAGCRCFWGSRMFSSPCAHAVKIDVVLLASVSFHLVDFEGWLHPPLFRSNADWMTRLCIHDRFEGTIASRYSTGVLKFEVVVSFVIFSLDLFF